jgi:N-acyl-D-amino-acid deacylase
MVSSAAREENKKYIGRTIKEIAETEHKDEYEFAFDLIADEEGKTAMIYFIMSPEDVRTAICYEHSIFISDAIYPPAGLPHPRLYGAFPRFIARMVRGEKALSLETAVKKMTSGPAGIFGIVNKGRIAEGYDADINIFDFEKLQDKASYIEPAQFSEGFDLVIVNGLIAVENDRLTGSTGGRFLRR